MRRHLLGASSLSSGTFRLQLADDFGHALTLASSSLDSGMEWSRLSSIFYMCPSCHRSLSSLSLGKIGAPQPRARGQTALPGDIYLGVFGATKTDDFPMRRGPFRSGSLNSCLLGVASSILLLDFESMAYAIVTDVVFFLNCLY